MHMKVGLSSRVWPAVLGGCLGLSLAGHEAGAKEFDCEPEAEYFDLELVDVVAVDGGAVGNEDGAWRKIGELILESGRIYVDDDELAPDTITVDAHRTIPFVRMYRVYDEDRG